METASTSAVIMVFTTMSFFWLSLLAVFVVFLLFVWIVGWPIKWFWLMIRDMLNPRI